MYRYSQRLPWDLPSNPLARLAHEKRQAGVPLLDLTASNPSEALQDYPHEAIRRAYGAVEEFTYRPEPLGLPQARTCITNWYAHRGILASPDRLALAASTSEAYALLFKLFCDPGSEILAPAPSYPLFEFLAALESVRIIPYRLLYDGAWFIDFDSLRERVSSRTRAIVLVNPNNPTGSFLKEHEREQLFRIAAEHNLPIISDEVFMEYSITHPVSRVPTLIGHDSVLSFSLNGLSKSAGMPQMKLAWIVVNGPLTDRQLAVNRLELLLDTYLSVSTPVQHALPDLLEIGAGLHAEIANRLMENLTALRQTLAGSPAHTLHLEGGWSAMIQMPATLSEEVWTTRLLNEYSVLVHPGYFFDMPSEPYLVASLITENKVFAEGIGRLRLLIDES